MLELGELRVWAVGRLWRRTGLCLELTPPVIFSRLHLRLGRRLCLLRLLPGLLVGLQGLNLLTQGLHLFSVAITSVKYLLEPIVRHAVPIFDLDLNFAFRLRSDLDLGCLFLRAFVYVLRFLGRNIDLWLGNRSSSRGGSGASTGWSSPIIAVNLCRVSSSRKPMDLLLNAQWAKYSTPCRSARIGQSVYHTSRNENHLSHFDTSCPSLFRIGAPHGWCWAWSGARLL